MSKKVWNLMYVAVNPAIFSGVTCNADNMDGLTYTVYLPRGKVAQMIEEAGGRSGQRISDLGRS